MRILIVAPTQPGISQAEIVSVASGNQPEIMAGLVTVQHVELMLRKQQFEVVHFMQHGTFGALKMSDADLDEQVLIQALKEQRGLQLVFVNACNSAGLAARVHNEVRVATVSHETGIDDRLAVVYAREMYKALRANGLDLHIADETAYSAFEREARSTGITNYVRPVLINGDMLTLQNLNRDLQKLRARFTSIDDNMRKILNWVRWVVPAIVIVLLSLTIIVYLTPR